MVSYDYELNLDGLLVALLLIGLPFKIVLGGFVGCILTLCAFVYFAVGKSFVGVDSPSPRRLKPVDASDSSSIPFCWEDSEFALSYPEIARVIEEIAELIVHSYIMPWYQHINASAGSDFPHSVKTTILQTVIKLQASLEQMDEGNLILLKILPLLAKHFEAFCLSKEAVVSDLIYEKSNSPNFELQVAVEYNKVNKMHPALSLRTSHLERDIGRYMTGKVEQFLPTMINEKELSSTFISTLLRDIFASCVLSPLVNKLSDGDFWNVLIISLSDKILEEQDQVQEIRKFLSKEVEQQEYDIVSKDNLDKAFELEQELCPGLSGAQFENYLRMISQLTSFEQLQKARFLLITKLIQLDKEELNTKILVEYRKRLVLSLNLLQTRLRRVDCRTSQDRSRHLNLNFSNAEKAVDDFQAFLDTIKLDDILRERRCIIHFEKYLAMSTSARGACYLKFWRLTESMKNPLEDAGEDVTVAISASEIARLQEFASTFFQEEQLEDMRLLDAGLVTNIMLFTESANCDANLTFPLARRSILLLQSEARRALDNTVFQDFKTSREFLDMVSCFDFVNTEIYSKLLVNHQHGESERYLNTRPSLSSTRVFSSPEINDALETLLTNSATKRRYSQQQTLDNTLFGDRRHEVPGDSLFEGDDDESYEPTTPILHNFEEDGSSISTKSETPNFNTPVSKIGRVTDTADLKNDIAKLSMVVDQIEKQLELLNHLTLKAELTNNQRQLKLLEKSKKALIRDLDTKELAKQQLMVQQDANSLYKKTKIAIKSYYVDRNRINHGDVIYYLINVEHVYQGQVTSWELPRRFSEFHKLNSYLRRTHNSSMQSLNGRDTFPKRMKMSLKFHVSKTLLYQERTTQLERYLNELLKVPQICQDDMLRNFLTDFSAFNVSPIRNDFKSDDLEQCDKLDDSNSLLSSSKEPTPRMGMCADYRIKQPDNHTEEESSLWENDSSHYEAYETILNSRNRSIVKSICDFFILVFSLNKTNTGWLRGRAIITVLQQLLGSAIEKYAVESIKKLRSEARFLAILTTLKEKVWPNNELVQREKGTNQRSEGELKRARADSHVMLQCLFAEFFGKVVGSQTAQSAATNIHDMIQNSYLNANLLLETIDLVFDEIMLSSSRKNRSAS